MGFSIGYNFIAKDKFTGAAKKISRSINKIKRGMRQTGMMAKKMARRMSKAGSSISKFGKKMSGMGKNMFKSVTLPIIGLGVAVLGAAGKMEKIKTGFVGMLGSAKKAGVLVKDLSEFTAKTPFQLGDVAGAAKKLLAAGVPVENIKNKLQMLGDISAAANVPLGDMAAIFSKSKNKGKAMTEELLQLSDKGIPIIDVLSRGLGVAKEKIFKLAETGKISFDILQKAMVQMSKKGEFANKAMVLQSATLFGVISTLKDNVILAAAAIGKEFLPEAKKFALFAIEIAQKTGGWVKENKKLVKIIGAILAVVAVIAPMLIGLGIAVSVIGTAITGLTTILGIAATVFGVITSPIFLLVAAIGFVLYKVLKLTGAWDFLMEKLSNLNPIKKMGEIFGSASKKIGGLIDKGKSWLGFGKNDINVNSRREISHGAASPVTSNQNNRSSIDGNVNVNILDKFKNVGSVNMSSSNGLNLGMNGAGI